MTTPAPKISIDWTEECRKTSRLQNRVRRLSCLWDRLKCAFEQDAGMLYQLSETQADKRAATKPVKDRFQEELLLAKAHRRQLIRSQKDVRLRRLLIYGSLMWMGGLLGLVWIVYILGACLRFFARVVVRTAAWFQCLGDAISRVFRRGPFRKDD